MHSNSFQKKLTLLLTATMGSTCTRICYHQQQWAAPASTGNNTVTDSNNFHKKLSMTAAMSSKSFHINITPSPIPDAWFYEMTQEKCNSIHA